MRKAQEIREELIPLVKAALPTKQEVFDRQRHLPCIDMTRASIFGFNKIVKDVVARYRRTHEPDEAELEKAVAQIKDMYLTLIQWEEQT